MNVNSSGTIGEFTVENCDFYSLRGLLRMKGGEGTLDKYNMINCTVDSIRNYGVLAVDINTWMCNDIVVKNKKIVDTTEKIKFIDSNLEKLSGMLFNQKSWSKFLNSITNKAEIQNVDLQYITNKYIDEHKGNFGHVLEIGVGCKGEYKNIINFMNEHEQNVLVTDIFKTEFISDSNSSQTVADIHISVWGINH